MVVASVTSTGVFALPSALADHGPIPWSPSRW
jgi:hypothetical protein